MDFRVKIIKGYCKTDFSVKLRIKQNSKIMYHMTPLPFKKKTTTKFQYSREY